METGVFVNFAIALGLGLLVGLERERAEERLAGIRTFALITLLGATMAMLAPAFGGWIIAAGLISLALLLMMSGVVSRQRGEEGPGTTTEVAALLMFGVGAACTSGFTGAGVVVGGTVALLLHWKRPLHLFVSHMGEGEFAAIVRLVLVALVILPVLPDKAYGAYGVLNPFKIWLMVVLIVSISLGAYLAYRLLGARVGVILAGVLGGLISSTATTVSYGRLSRRHPAAATTSAVVIMLASTVVFVRVLFEIQLVAPTVMSSVAPPLIAMMLLMGAIALGTFVIGRRGLAELPDGDAPSDLRAAIVFGLLYAAVLYAIAAAREHFGEGALYGVAALSGLTDMDAITLSTAQMIKSDGLSADTGWRLILVGAMANIVFKGLAVGFLGHPRLLLRVAIMFAIALAGGAALLFLWPATAAA